MIRYLTTITLLLLAFASPRLHAQEVGFTGIISEINASEWIIDGRPVIVTPETELSADDGPLVVGACADVEGKTLDGGAIQADEISSEDPSECSQSGGNDDGNDDGGDDDDGDDDDGDDDDGDDDGDDDDGDDGDGDNDGDDDDGDDGDDDDHDGIGESELTGRIDSLPNGLIGLWTIMGALVEVTDFTELEEDDGPFVAGACVEVEGVRNADGVLLAQEIETESDDDCTPGDDDGDDDDIELTGELEQLPSDGRIGDWLVAGTTVRVLASTEIDSDRGPFALGACLEVEGSSLADGSVEADEIEVLSAAGGCAARDDDDGSVELDGVVQEAPANDRGLWLISGRTVLTDDRTEIELTGSGSRVGRCVEVEGDFVEGGVLLASEIDEDDDAGRNCGAGPGVPAEVELYGLIDALPTGNGLSGQWTINGVQVVVSGATELEEDDDGMFAVGQCAKATGSLLANGNLQAREVETESDDDCGGVDLVAGEVEFRGIATDAPEDGPLGLWTIGFQPVEVAGDSEIEEEDGRLRLGACIKVEGSRQDDGTILAREIEVETASGLCVASNGIVNAASFDDDAVSPGEIMSIFGLRMGPPAGAGLQLDDGDGRVRAEVEGVRVWFDSEPAPILFARDDQVNVVAPYSVAGKSSVQVQIEWRGAWSRPIQLPVAAADPGLLTLSQSGQGQVAALNVAADGAITVNGSSSPANAGQAITLFAVGAGRFSRSFADGLVVGDDLPEPELPVRVFIGGQEAQVTYAGGAPGLVLGVLQVNVIVPEGAALGDVEVTIQVGEFMSQSGVTMSIQ